MPSTVTGLLLVIVALLPGYTYTAVRAHLHPRRDRTHFQETVTTVFASVVCVAIVLVLFGVTRTLSPSRTPDVRRLVNDGDAYWRAHYNVLVWWAAGALGLACLIGAVLAWPEWMRERTHNISAWEHALDRAAEEAFEIEGSGRGQVFARIELVDGSFVSGYVGTFNYDENESADRDLYLSDAISYRRSPDDKEELLEHVSTAVVSARHMKVMMLCYERPVDAPTSGEPKREPAQTAGTR